MLTTKRKNHKKYRTLRNIQNEKSFIKFKNKIHSLSKHPKIKPGISDQNMIPTDLNTKHRYQRSKPRKCNIHSKANKNNNIKDALTNIHSDNYNKNNWDKITKNTNTKKPEMTVFFS